MSQLYHPGERAVQAQAGSVVAADAMERQVLPVIAHLYTDFLQRQPFVIIGSADSSGLAWASIICGQPGLMRITDERTLEIQGTPGRDDPLGEGLREGCAIGLLAIDFATCRRVRLNGTITGRTASSLTAGTSQVYANCPRYIQIRTPVAAEVEAKENNVRHGVALDDTARSLIRQADTFFLASYHSTGGADVSHRGGFPGFVKIEDDTTLVWPDYNGNGMFNSLGNITANHACGLLFMDFARGTTLQLSGVAEIILDQERAGEFPGAERLITCSIKQCVTREGVVPLRWELKEYSQDNPWFC